MAIEQETFIDAADLLPSEGGILNREGFIPVRPVRRYVLAADIGQSVDPTAIAIACYVRDPLPAPEGIGADLVQRLGPARFEVSFLERVPLGTPYPAVVQHVGNLLARSPLRGNCELVIDRTGVGRAVFDLFVLAGLSPIGVTITSGGDKETQEPDGSGWRVGKLALVSRLQSELHSGTLKISSQLPDAPALISELGDFRANISDAGFASFGARTGKHDDLVLSLALAIWHLAPRTNSGYSTEAAPWA